MATDFAPPSYRAASSDLSISISPLGLVELADEEFEVHGPRLNRYALNWAMYLGHHWSYQVPAGDAQQTFNWTRRLIDFMNSFTFGKGVQFRSPKATEAIVPNLLKEVWEQHNDKESVLWEMAQQGGVSGDCFVKIAWDPEYKNEMTGDTMPGRVRIMPLQAAFCFPEWHPHDKERLIRFKLKYRFWGTSPEGTRQVFTYTEILTDDWVEEYINDTLIEGGQRVNPLGVIPIVHIPEAPISGSPWGLGLAQDILGLNRTYNEVATDIQEIINYHAAPVTIMTGAKVSQLERGANRIWGGLPEKAQVFNLDGGIAGIDAAMAFLDKLKTAMHEITGVPETALGQVQPISNTSGVALAIQFQPLMNVHNRRTTTYEKGLVKINEYALRTLASVHPERFTWTEEDSSAIGSESQLMSLDLHDSITFQSIIHWPPPLPLDTLIVLNEIQQKISLGLESKAGALRALGDESPEDKLAEIREELRNDAIADGALNLLKAAIFAQITELTGMSVGPDGTVTPAIDPAMAGQLDADPESPGINSNLPVLGGSTPTQPGAVIEELSQADLQNKLVTGAYGTKIPQRRNPESDADSS